MRSLPGPPTIVSSPKPPSSSSSPAPPSMRSMRVAGHDAVVAAEGRSRRRRRRSRAEDLVGRVVAHEGAARTPRSRCSTSRTSSPSPGLPSSAPPPRVTLSRRDARVAGASGRSASTLSMPGPPSMTSGRRLGVVVAVEDVVAVAAVERVAAALAVELVVARRRRRRASLPPQPLSSSLPSPPETLLARGVALEEVVARAEVDDDRAVGQRARRRGASSRPCRCPRRWRPARRPGRAGTRRLGGLVVRAEALRRLRARTTRGPGGCPGRRPRP